MKKFMLIVLLSFVFLLGGCTSNKTPVEDPNAVTLSGCLEDVGAGASVKGENLTYYYVSQDEISLYYSKNWKKGIISWKRFFVNEEQYNLQKSLYPDAVCKDAQKTILIKEYIKVDDMDAYWDSIENSSVYTMVK